MGKETKKCFVLFKIDIVKAYDKIVVGFFSSIMIKMSMPKSFVNILFHLAGATTNLNDQPMDSFPIHKQVR